MREECHNRESQVVLRNKWNLPNFFLVPIFVFYCSSSIIFLHFPMQLNLEIGLFKAVVLLVENYN